MTNRDRAYKCQCHKTYFFDSSLTLVQNKLGRLILEIFKSLSWSLVVSRPKGWRKSGSFIVEKDNIASMGWYRPIKAPWKCILRHWAGM